MVGTIVVAFAEYAKLTFVHTTKSTKIYTPRKFRGRGGVVGTIVVAFAEYAKLTFVHTTKSTKIYTPRKFLYAYGMCMTLRI